MLKLVQEEFTKIESDFSRVFYQLAGKQFIPEKLALEYYKEKDYEGIWAENDYWNTVLSLLFWDVIFAKVRGAVAFSRNGVLEEPDPMYPQDKEIFDKMFLSFIKMNGMPHDMFSKHFAINRIELIKARYKQLTNIKISERLKEAYQKYKGKNCRLINDWNKYSLSELIAPIKVLDKRILLRILLRLIINISENRSGFPDLLVFKNNEIRFVEVKSENDTLSQNQINCITLLNLDLDQSVDIFLINHTPSKLSKIEESFKILLLPIKIEIGDTSSGKRNEMISLFRSRPDYSEIKNRPTASFPIQHEELEEIIKTVGRWKTSKFFVGGIEYTSDQIKNVIYEYHSNKNFNLENYNFWAGYDTSYGCNNLEIAYANDQDWKKFGYIDTTTKEWVFDLKKIKEVVENQLEENILCPYIDSKRVKKDFLKLPERIDPKKDDLWGFIDNNRNRWIYNKDKWITDYSESTFPGINSIVGVTRLNKEDSQEIIQKQYNSCSTYDSEIEIKVSPQTRKKGSGCLGIFIVLVMLLIITL
ncbi:VRR-NUC domain-containing protein [Patescibacteria group bacterium]|nr:VRR-NUC domain-containing protein [Patescibacteria group bacterium]